MLGMDPTYWINEIREWFTVRWAVTGGRLATWLYARHWSEWTTVPGATWFWMMRSNVVLHLNQLHIPQGWCVRRIYYPKNPCILSRSSSTVMLWVEAMHLKLILDFTMYIVYLWLMAKLWLINLNHHTRPTQNDECLEEWGGTNLSQPLINLTRSGFCHLCLCGSCTHWILSSPPYYQPKPLSKCQLRLGKKTVGTYGLCRFAWSTAPAHPIWSSLFSLSLNHLIYCIYLFFIS